MAKKTTKKAAAEAEDQTASAPVIAFEYFETINEDTGESQPSWKRLEMTEAEFDALPKDSPIKRGVFVEMQVSIEGGRFSLRPGQKAWIPPHCYEAWKAAGKCKPSSDDSQVAETLEARAVALRKAAERETELQTECDELKAQVQDLSLHIASARGALGDLEDTIRPDKDSDIVLDDQTQAVLQKVIEILEILPDVVLQDDAPELNLE